ncbi:MAG TPA: helix-hairpin-helix domain-containing protein, partial [Holophagaceae bacterium]|nr:helix-hairpin-helix domain-containing protein [Holophagaceae bacterium]
LVRAAVLAAALPLAAGAHGARGPAAPKRPAHPINLNTASATELMQLPHVGARTAERIVAFRKAHGGFQRLEELIEVKGVGEKAFAQLKPFLTLGPAK